MVRLSIALLVAVLALVVAPHCAVAQSEDSLVRAGHTLRRYLKGDPSKGMHGLKGGRVVGKHKNKQKSGNNRAVGLHCNRNKTICLDPKQNPKGGPVCCGRSCISVINNDFHCGQCGRKCGSGSKCCGTSCVDLLSNQNNCGACGVKCNKKTCFAGLCSYGV